MITSNEEAWRLAKKLRNDYPTISDLMEMVLGARNERDRETSMELLKMTLEEMEDLNEADDR